MIRQSDGVVPPLPQGQANDAQEGPGQAGVGEAEVQAEGAGVADQRVARSKPFRLRSRGCLFTYNSLAFRPDMWEDFVSWLNTLEFLGRWTATMEESLRSEDRRFHLHVFMEFVDSVDWTSLRSVRFHECSATRLSLPSARFQSTRGFKPWTLLCLCKQDLDSASRNIWVCTLGRLRCQRLVD